MFIQVFVNGVSKQCPGPNDNDWGQDVQDIIVSLCANYLSKQGGNFQLVNDVNFGPNFGLISSAFKSISSNPSATGIVRLANGDSISFRNGANNGDLSLKINNTNNLQFNNILIVDESTNQNLLNKNVLVVPVNFPVPIIVNENFGFAKLLRCTATTTTQVTLPDDNVNIPVGTEIPFLQGNIGQIQFIAGVGATINTPYATNLTRTRYSIASAIKTDPNTWLLAGDFQT